MRHVSHRCTVPLAAAVASVALASAVPALAGQHAIPNATGSMTSSELNHEAASDARDRVSDATTLVHQMKQNPGLATVLERAKGIFVIPHYGKGGFIVGGQGGGGVVLARHENEWSSPAFYSIGGGSIGAQAGAEGGGVALILMTQKAVDRFANETNTWSLNGSAGLTVVNWSDKTQANTGRGDVILWSNTSGLYGGLTASVTHVAPDIKMDHAYYQRPVRSSEILAGNVSAPDAESLRNALAQRVASSSY